MRKNATSISSGQVCSRCQDLIAEGQKVCGCGKATPYMSFAERTEYEVQQWRAYRAQMSA